MQRDPADDQGDARYILDCWDLAQHDRADDGGEHGQQRKHQREGRPWQPCHGQLVGDVGNHRRRHPDADSGEQPRRVCKRGQGAAEPDWSGRHGGDQHGRAKLINAVYRPLPGTWPPPWRPVPSPPRVVSLSLVELAIRWPRMT